MRALVLTVWALGGGLACGAGGLCATKAATGITPATFARGAPVTLTVTYPAGTFASVPPVSGFAGEFLVPGGSSIAGTVAGPMTTGAVTGLTVMDATTVLITINLPASAAAGTYTLILNFRGSACGGGNPGTMLAVSVT